MAVTSCDPTMYEAKVAESYALARRYTRSHRENFSVLSWLLPKRLRDDFSAVYTFCRACDNMADHAESTDEALDQIRDVRTQLTDCFAGRIDGDMALMMYGLHAAATKYDLPAKPFHDLLDAFEMDQRVTRYDTYEQLRDYCRLSADPVGHLVLKMGGYDDAARTRLADATCTALQLVNHVQDVRRDVLERGRVYLPADLAMKHGLDLEQLARMIRDDARAQGETIRGEADCSACVSGSAGLGALRPAYRAVLGELCERIEALFDEGRKLWPRLASSSGVVRPVKAFTLGGEAVLRRVRAMDFDTPMRRPRLSKATKLGLLVRVATGATGR